MTKFGVMSILRRYPPFVVGNSTSNISQLIDDENLIRTRMDLLPIVYPVVNPIKLIVGLHCL
jgi:cyanophycin synthetase